MAYFSAGTPVPLHVSFNSGQLDFGSNRLVNLDNVKIDYKFSEASFYVLNSIKKAGHARHSLAVTLTAKTHNLSQTVEAMFFGASSSDATTIMNSVLDGQPTYQNPVLTVIDDSGASHQYQMVSAMLTSDSVNTTNEDYTTWDLTWECTDINYLGPIAQTA